MKNIMKKVVAFLCVLTLSVGAMAAWAPAKEVKATETSTDPTPVYLEGFRHVTLSNFTNSADGQITDGTYNTDKVYLMRDNAGNTVENFDKALISFKIKYSGGDGPKLRLGGSNTVGLDTGFWIYPSGSGKGLYIINKANDKYPLVSNGESATPYVLTRVLTNGNTEYLSETFFKDNEFLLQLSFEYADSNNDGVDDILKLGIYVDGNPMTLEDRRTNDFANCSFDEDGRILMSVNATNMGYHGACFAFEDMSDTNTIQISSVVPKDVSKITLPNKAFLKSGQIAYELKDSDTITQLANTSFEGKVTFLSATDKDMIYYGGSAGGNGLCFKAYDGGNQLLLQLGDTAYYLDAATAGVTSFVDNEIRLKITTEYADYDNDGDAQDIQLGIYIKGNLYNNRYLYVYDYTIVTDVGNYVTIYSDGSDDNAKGIMIRSVSDVTDVTYDLSVLENATYGSAGIATDFGTVTKAMLSDTEITDISSGLTIAGDYTLYNGDELVGEAVLYKAGDVHPDSESDVRDLVAMMKVNANVAFDTWAGTMGAYKAGFSETEIINNLLGITEQ